MNAQGDTSVPLVISVDHGTHEVETVAVVRYVTGDRVADVVYVGTLDEVNTYIEIDSQGDDDEIVDDAQLLWSNRTAAELGFTR